MKRVRRALELLHERGIKQEFDRVVPVIGDEGVGKSTFMLRVTVNWKDITDQPVTIDDILGQLVWGERPEFKEALATYPARAAIPVMDAGRILHKKEAMAGEQVEIEKDFLDVRIKENLILLGFQDWGIVPTPLQERRAKNVFVIPRRGVVHGYNRESIDERVEDGEWPEPNLVDTYESLEGTELWRRFKDEDIQRKKDRIMDDDGEEESDRDVIQATVERIKENGLEDVVSIHGVRGTPYVDHDLISYEYDLSARKSKTVKKILEKDEQVQRWMEEEKVKP